MHHLKEHGQNPGSGFVLNYVKSSSPSGMTSWVNEYVVKRNLAIPHLLLAFGINLVGIPWGFLRCIFPSNCLHVCLESKFAHHVASHLNLFLTSRDEPRASELRIEILISDISDRLQLRDKLPHYNTVEDALRLIRDSRKILILTGAGISVSCGIPDFRSRDGLYASLKQRGDYDLDDPQQM